MRIGIKIPSSVAPDLLRTMRTYRISIHEAVGVLILASASELTPRSVDRLLEIVRRPEEPCEEVIP